MAGAATGGAEGSLGGLVAGKPSMGSPGMRGMVGFGFTFNLSFRRFADVEKGVKHGLSLRNCFFFAGRWEIPPPWTGSLLARADKWLDDGRLGAAVRWTVHRYR
jgi:hypothetical protein